MPILGDADPSAGMELICLDESIEHDGHGYYINFETTSLRFLSAICYWLERKRPGLVVSRVIPGHLSPVESCRHRQSDVPRILIGETEWVVKIDGEGRQSFLLTAHFDWRPID